MDTDRAVIPEDHPHDRSKSGHDKATIKKVAFLIHISISPREWAVIEPEDANHGRVATLRIQTAIGTAMFHNVYNHNKAVDYEDVVWACSSDGGHAILSDCNLHAPEWCGEAGPSDRGGIELARPVREAGMVCLNEPGRTTYSRGRSETGLGTSAINFIFVGSSLHSRLLPEPERYRILDPHPFDTDRRISEVSFDFEITSTPLLSLVI